MPTAASRTALRLALAGLALLTAPIAASPAAAAVQSERVSYVLLNPGSRSSTMSGTVEDVRRAQALRSGDEGLLYVRRGGAAYVIRDSATLRRAQALFQPQEALGARQAELGSRQAALGREQAQLGAQQARLGRRQAGATPQLAVDLGRQQDALGRQQAALGSRQAALGRQQDELGREQDRLGRIAEGQLRALIAEAIERGAAQRVD